jgi:hypothetical protein
MEWWILSVEIKHVALRGLGIGGLPTRRHATLRPGLRRPRGRHDQRPQRPSLGLFHKLGFTVHPDSRIVHEGCETSKSRMSTSLCVASCRG